MLVLCILLNKTWLSIFVFANRASKCLLGVARSASAFLGGRFLLTFHLFKAIFPRGKDTGLVNVFLLRVELFGLI